jgi:hypothetical protein
MAIAIGTATRIDPVSSDEAATRTTPPQQTPPTKPRTGIRRFRAGAAIAEEHACADDVSTGR